VTSEPDFKVTTLFEVKCRKTRRVLKNEVTIAQQETGTMFGDLD